MRSRYLAALLFAFLIAPGVAFAEFGLGLMVGEPTGLSAKIGFSDANAVDFGLAYSLNSEQRLHFHADYLFYFPNAIDVREGELKPYLGIGGRFVTVDDTALDPDDDDDPRIGARVPIGLNYEIGALPLELFLEAAVIVDLVPETEADFNAGIGLRYLF